MKLCVRNRMLSGHTNVSRNIEKQFFRENGLLLNSAAAVVVAADFVVGVGAAVDVVDCGRSKEIREKAFFQNRPNFPPGREICFKNFAVCLS